MELINANGGLTKQVQPRLSAEEKQQILASARMRLEFSCANAKDERKCAPPEVAICGHCGKPMQFADARFCEPCGKVESSRLQQAADAEFRGQNWLLFKVFAVVLFVGFLVIAFMLKFAT